uniref:DUF4007 domain-containing protein n=1 Tax=Thermosporothrix sp. COM3 TaxID=2490863 RepID=A0A455SJR5_9CHLR|nr:hypothetical protein KTC_23020 [Thermosporothrix sp. COM3]
MATTALVFHFPVAATPTKIPKLLRVLLYAETPITRATELDELAFAENTDTNRFSEARKLAEETLGLIETTKEGLTLTPEAHILLKKRESIQYDLLHYLFYTAWNAKDPIKQTRSWFYRAVCDNLWNMQDVTLDRSMRQILTQELDGQIREEFQQVPGISERLSIGIQTMDGAREWLRHLQPAVIEKVHKGEERFQRRSTCSAELFLLALSRSYELSGTEIGIDVLISPQRRDDVCRLCLLDPLQFDRMLDWTLPIYPQFISQGTRSGSYGRFIRLHRFVTLKELAYKEG